MKKTVFCIAILLFNFNIYSQQDSIQTIDEVIIKTVRVGANAPITHSNLSKKDLEKRNLGQDIPILLKALPNVVTTSDAGAGVGYTSIRVRGVSPQSTNITINGIPYNDAESLGTYWVDLPDFSSSVESLQLQRGVGTSTNGSGAFGASINVLTDAISENANGEISNAFGSYNTRKHTIKFSTGKINKHIEIAGRLSKIASNGYIDRATSDLNSHFLQASYVDNNTLIKALTFGGHEITYQAWNGVSQDQIDTYGPTYNPSGAYTDLNGVAQFYKNEVDNYKQSHYQLHWNEKFNKQWSTNLGLNYTKGKGYFEQYKEDEDFGDYDLTNIIIGGTTISSTDLIRRRWLDNDFYVVNLNASYTKQDLLLSFGSSYSTYNGDHFGEIIWARTASDSELGQHYYDGNGKKEDLSFFTKATYKLNAKVSLFGDLQLRNVNYNTTGLTSKRNVFEIDKKHSFFNPKMGITYTLNNFNHIYASYAKANREPSRSDYKENNNIQPERLNDFELGWRFQKDNIIINTNLYAMLYNEQLVLTGQLNDVGTPIRDNSGKSSRIGLEIDANIRLSEKINWQPTFALSTNKNKQKHAQIDGSLTNLGSTNISFSPAIVASNNISYKPSKNLEFALLSKYVGKQYMSNIDSKASVLDAYFVNDLNINYTINTKRVFKSIVVSALVNNLFNKTYISNGYYYSYDDTWSTPGQTTTIEGTGYYPQATRNFLLGASLKF